MAGCMRVFARASPMLVATLVALALLVPLLLPGDRVPGASAADGGVPGPQPTCHPAHPDEPPPAGPFPVCQVTSSASPAALPADGGSVSPSPTSESSSPTPSAGGSVSPSPTSGALSPTPAESVDTSISPSPSESVVASPLSAASGSPSPLAIAPGQADSNDGVALPTSPAPTASPDLSLSPLPLPSADVPSPPAPVVTVAPPLPTVTLNPPPQPSLEPLPVIRFDDETQGATQLDGSGRTGRNGPASTTVPGTTFVTGEQIVLTGEGWLPDSVVSIYLFSSPVLLGTSTVDEQGAFTTTVRIPNDTAAGEHHLIMTGLDEDGLPRKVSIPITLLSSPEDVDGVAGRAPGPQLLAARTTQGQPLAQTGGRALTLGVRGLLLLLLGVALRRGGGRRPRLS